MFKTDNNKIVDSGSDKTNETIINLFINLTGISNIRATKKPIFPTSNAKKVFNYLK